MDNIKSIESLTEAITLLYIANGRNSNTWAENRVRNAIKHLEMQQTILCQVEFPKEQ